MPNIIESTESKPKNKSADPSYAKNYYLKNKQKMDACRQKNLAIKNCKMSAEKAGLYGVHACHVNAILTKIKKIKVENPELIQMLMNEINEQILEKNEDI